MQKSIDIFLGYAVEDTELCLEIKKRLKWLEHKGLIRIWHEYMISAGMEREREILHHLEMAHIILLFVSADFLASDFCYGVELMQAMKRHERGDARVIPIIVRSVYWEETPLGNLQALPRGYKSVSQNSLDRDKILTEIEADIRVVIKDLVAEKYIQEGLSSFKQTQYENTVEACDDALNLKPDFTIAYHLKGLALLELKRYDEVIQAYDQIIHSMSGNASIHKARGDALYHLHQYDNALVSYKKAISLKTGFVAAYKGARDTLREIAKANIRLAEIYDEQIRNISQLEENSTQEDFQ